MEEQSVDYGFFNGQFSCSLYSCVGQKQLGNNTGGTEQNNNWNWQFLEIKLPHIFFLSFVDFYTLYHHLKQSNRAYCFTKCKANSTIITPISTRNTISGTLSANNLHPWDLTERNFYLQRKKKGCVTKMTSSFFHTRGKETANVNMSRAGQAPRPAWDARPRNLVILFWLLRRLLTQDEVVQPLRQRLYCHLTAAHTNGNATSWQDQ